MGICYAVSVNTGGSNLKGKAMSVFVLSRKTFLGENFLGCLLLKQRGRRVESVGINWAGKLKITARRKVGKCYFKPKKCYQTYLKVTDL